MPWFGQSKQTRHRQGGNGHSQPHRYRIASRGELLQKYDLIATAGQRRAPADGDERQRLARVLEEYAAEGWKLISVTDGEFFFRIRD